MSIANLICAEVHHDCPTSIALAQPQRMLALGHRLGPDTEWLVLPEQRLTRRQVFERVDRLAAGLLPDWVRPQAYANLYPKELMLRDHV